MATKITREILESYLYCKTKAHLKLVGEQGTKSDYVELLATTRQEVRQTAIERILARQPEGQLPRDVPLTAATLGNGPSYVLGATLEDDVFSLEFDGLKRVDGPSKLGDFHYVPILFHEGRKVGSQQRLLLELHGLLLNRIQARLPAFGLVWHGPECKGTRIRLNPERRRADRFLREAKEMASPGPLPRLMLNDHCPVCEFRRSCLEDAQSRDDLSLLRGMSEEEVKKYGKRGIFTVTQLSCTFRPRKTSRKAQDNGPPHSHALQALAIREKKIHVIGSPKLPVCPSQTYFDIEGDPDRGFVYLIGMVVVKGDREERFSFWADSPSEETRLFDQFLDSVRRQEDARLFTYGSYEAQFLRRMGKLSARQEPVEGILAKTHNILSIIYSHVYFPVYFNGLKEVAGSLGFAWTEPNASGVQSVVWRRRWEATGSSELRDKLTTYNIEDCLALRRVTEFLYAICPDRGPEESKSLAGCEGHAVARVEDLNPVSSRRQWCQAEFAIPDFDFVNKRAYFDYQRDRVFIRSSKLIKKNQARRRGRTRKKDLRADRSIELASEECPSCGGKQLTRFSDGRLVRFAFDLKVRRGGIRRWVTRYTTKRHWCRGCDKRFLPSEYLRLEEYCHGLKSWTMYEHVVHRASFASIAWKIKDYFGLPVFTPDVRAFKQLISRYYEGTYQRLREKIVGGSLVHADETEVHLRREGKGYVWVFTNLEEVLYLYRKSREGSFLPEFLRGFSGVLVSDFYAAYDSIECFQQKCLIHLMRDFNHDLHANPWDEELKSLASDFGTLLRAIVSTIDRHGLKTRHMGRHRKDVDKFFLSLAGEEHSSDVAEGYRSRLLKYRDKLFTFLDHDGVPWNNNNAEHAVKRFADYRETADGHFSEHGLNEYLVILSIYMSCKYKSVPFLRFLLSGETDIDAFCRGYRHHRRLPAIELQPEGFTFTRRKRRTS